MKKLGLLLAAPLLTACASTSAGDYFINRGADLVDILRMHVAAGMGVAVKAEATRFIHLGIVWEDDCWAWGLANREVCKWNESIWSWGLLVGHWDEESVVGTSDGRVSGSYGWVFGEKGNGFQMADEHNMLDVLTFRGTLMLGIGIDLEIRVGEVLDFVAGIFQFDPAGDDIQASKMKKPAETAEPAAESE
jgi:hypothetical protein